MKICILVPSRDHMKQAGVRIRYKRIEQSLLGLGHELVVTPIDDLARPEHFVHDVYIVSKCYDARALLIPLVLRGTGKSVGVDLFDDYFSQVGDSRFMRLRVWLRDLLDNCDFILTSTPGMSELASKLAPELPVLIMNDPSLPIDETALVAGLKQKIEGVSQTKVLNVAWFGIGDNPHFPLGLTDLVAYSGHLARLRGQGFDVRLNVLTNRRAMTGPALAMLNRLPVPHSLDEWSEEREAVLLAKSTVCFLPVNAQRFSVVKSLNRAVSALSSGVQVLSAGYPLYDPLSAFIYRDPARMVRDLHEGRPALREETVPAFLDLMKQLASGDVEAARLADFLDANKNRCPGGGPSPDGPLSAVIHGQESPTAVHKFAQRMTAFSVASPYASPKLNYDLRVGFDEVFGELAVYLAEKHRPAVERSISSVMLPHGRIVDTDYVKVPLRTLLPDEGASLASLAVSRPDHGMLGGYSRIMAGVGQAVVRLFPTARFCYSEQSRMPLWIEPHERELCLEVA